MTPLRHLLDLTPHELLQPIRRFRIRRRLSIVPPTIIKDQLRILDKVVRGGIEILLVLLFHGREIHGLLDDVVVVVHLVCVDGLQKRPGIVVVLHVVEEVEKLVVVGSVARLAGELVHVGRPARSFDGGNGEWVDDGESFIFGDVDPLRRGLVDVV